MELVLLSGLSGSGKSIALNVLEDASYYTVDNLPPEMIPLLMEHIQANHPKRAAIAVDMRSGEGISALPQVLSSLQSAGHRVRFIFLDARDNTLIARFSETRRRHPLCEEDVSLEEAIAKEREALAPIAELGHHMDTSDIQPNTLRKWVKDFISIPPCAGLTLMFESFGFKYNIPLDADLVFDARCLPNPFYDTTLRPLTGQDAPVIAFLSSIPEVQEMENDIQNFVAKWLPRYQRDNRSYLTIGIGCTGGQHRSVYLAERLGQYFSTHTQTPVLIRHRNASRRPD